MRKYQEDLKTSQNYNLVLSLPPKIKILSILAKKLQFVSNILSMVVDKHVAIFLISETKLDDSFPSAQFKIESFTTSYRYDRNNKGGGLLLYIREDILSRLLQCKSQCNIESLSVEINLRKRKWFLNCSYNPHRNSVSSHLECLNRIIDEPMITLLS